MTKDELEQKVQELERRLEKVEKFISPSLTLGTQLDSAAVTGVLMPLADPCWPPNVIGSITAVKTDP